MDQVRKNILILDQDEKVLIELEGLLESEGFETTTTWYLNEAVDLLAHRVFDLVLVGDHPPQVRCSALLKMLRSRENRPPCIVLQTASRYPFEAEYLCWLGAYAVSAKSKHRDLVSRIRECLSTTESSGTAPKRKAGTA